MIDDKILDEILPVPDIDSLKQDTIAQLQAEGFVITNFNSGGIFNALLMIALRIRIELRTLSRTLLNNMFVTHAQGDWLNLKAADYSKQQKEALKAQGYVTVSRGDTDEAILVPKGQVFKTIKDINGEELRYFVLNDTILQQGQNTVDVLIEAENAGAKYNVPAGQITRSLTYIDGGCTLANTTGWLTREGSDEEDLESLRERTLRSWSELATQTTADKYKNACEAVPGVLFVKVDDLHPRGQGTVDIIVTSPTGSATESLINQVKAAADKIKGPYDNVLVKSSVTVSQAITVTVTISEAISDTGITDAVTAALTDLLKVSRNRDLNVLTQADIIYAIKSKVSYIRNVRIAVPDEDITLEADKVIILGTVTVTIERV